MGARRPRYRENRCGEFHAVELHHSTRPLVAPSRAIHLTALRFARDTQRSGPFAAATRPAAAEATTENLRSTVVALGLTLEFHPQMTQILLINLCNQSIR